MKMRSLFVDDIPGAKPKRHYFTKQLYRQRHEQEIIRHAKKNPEEKRVFEWYNPMKKPTEPLDRNDQQQWRTKKTLMKSFGLESADMSKSLPVSQMRSKSVLFDNSDLSKSNILEGSGRKSLVMSSARAPTGQDPYFPHRYTDKAVGQPNKWSGSRMWPQQATKIINLPSVKQSYYKRW